jgi:hypothetical protein
MQKKHFSFFSNNKNNCKNSNNSSDINCNNNRINNQSENNMVVNNDTSSTSETFNIINRSDQPKFGLIANRLDNQAVRINTSEPIVVPSTFTKYINHGFENTNVRNDEKLANNQTSNTNESIISETDKNLTSTLNYEITLNSTTSKFKTKLAHPLSSSILKTTMSILDSAENNPNNFNQYGTSSNDSIYGINSATTSTNNNNASIVNENSRITGQDGNECGEEETDASAVISPPLPVSIPKRKSILKKRHRTSYNVNNSPTTGSKEAIETSSLPPAVPANNHNNQLSYFKMFESFLCEKKASFKSLGQRNLNNDVPSKAKTSFRATESHCLSPIKASDNIVNGMK